MLTESPVIIANRAATSAYDAMVLILTIVRTARLQKQAARLSMSTGLLALLLKDGECILSLPAQLRSLTKLKAPCTLREYGPRVQRGAKQEPDVNSGHCYA